MTCFDLRFLSKRRSCWGIFWALNWMSWRLQIRVYLGCTSVYFLPHLAGTEYLNPIQWRLLIKYMFLIEKMTQNTFFRLNKLSYSVLVLFVGGTSISSAVYAQVDAGALQQNLERQLPLPSPLALPSSQTYRSTWKRLQSGWSAFYGQFFCFGRCKATSWSYGSGCSQGMGWQTR